MSLITESKKSSKFLIGAWFILSLLAIAGNVLSVELFFGVEFIFGSIASLIAIVWLGPLRGILVAALGSAYTFAVWHHPYAFINLVIEAIFVASILKRAKYNVAIASGAYWVSIGMPLAWVLYRFGIGLDSSGALLIAVKQGSNGILNAVLAFLLLTYLPIRRVLGQNYVGRITVFQHMFAVFISLSLVPALFLVVIDARKARDQVEQDIRTNLNSISSSLSLSVQKWIAQHINAVEQLKLMGRDFGISDQRSLQKFAEESQQIWSDFHGVYFADKLGTTIAFTPVKNYKGQSTIGLNFADRPYFKVLKSGEKQIYISDVFMARGGVFEPVVNVAGRIENNQRFAGIVVGTLNLKDLKEIFKNIPTSSPFNATLVEANGTVIASTDSSLKSLEKFGQKTSGAVIENDQDYFRRSPPKAQQNPMSYWGASYLGKSNVISGGSNWKLIVEIPVANSVAILNEKYIQVLSFLIVLALVILAASAWIASNIANLLSTLSRETTNLPARIESNEKIDWPSGGLVEIENLVENFKTTLIALKKRFSDLEQSKKELNRANSMKDEFLAMLSHELRTPLNAIVGHAELLKSESLSTDQSESVETIYRNAHAQNRIIADLLDVSAIMTGKLTFTPSVISLNDIVRSVVKSIETSAETRGHIEMALDGRDQLLLADGVRMQQVVWNLLSNAIKFAPENGSVSISTNVENHGCTISVSDHGKGIDPEFLPHIFDRFRQEDSSRTRTFGGLGLGLAIVKQIVEGHGGQVSAVSAGKNKGSAFTVYLPNTIYYNERHGEKFAKADLPPIDLSGVRVLIVDDDADARMLSKRILSKNGATVELATSARDGIDKFKIFNPDVVVSDIGMPVEDGYTFLKYLRCLDKGIDIPVAALTAFAMESDKRAILAAGFQAHITKPLGKGELTKVVSDLIAKSRVSRIN